MFKMTENDYDKYVKARMPKSKLWRDTGLAFLFGGGICVLGQAFADIFAKLGADREHSLGYATITLIFISALLTAFGVYDNIAKVAGAGIIVPITGFANSVVSPAMEFKSEGLVLGLAAKMFIVAGPVLVYGILSSVLYGILLLIIR